MLCLHCRYITELLGGEQYVSCSVVLPALCHLLRTMAVSDVDPAYIARFKAAFTKNLNGRKENSNLWWLKVPLQWWSSQAGTYGKLAHIAKRYLATPASAVPCGRLFSLAGHVLQKKRSAPSSENVNKLVCLSNWLGGGTKKTHTHTNVLDYAQYLRLWRRGAWSSISCARRGGGPNRQAMRTHLCWISQSLFVCVCLCFQ